MKRYKKGMVLGKFMPLHNGHKHLIDTAIEHSEHVDIFICSLENEPIDGKLRYEWVRASYSQYNVDIHWVTDELPQTPEECESTDAFYDLWCKVVWNRTDKLDVIFTSEEYGDEFASELSIKHHLVDIDRTAIPVSGTMIRENPFQYWDYIPEVVRPYFKKKIVIMGPESTGKSTLTKRLVEEFGGDTMEEYGREFTDMKPAKEMTVKDFEQIAFIHDVKMRSVIRMGKAQLIFIDTEAITTYLFGKMYLGDDFNSQFILDIVHLQEFDLILLCDIDVPWVNDGTRDFPHGREKHMGMLTSALNMMDRRDFTLVQGDYDERFEQAKEAVLKIF